MFVMRDVRNTYGSDSRISRRSSIAPPGGAGGVRPCVRRGPCGAAAGFCERAAVNQSVITPNHPSDSNIAEGADVQTYLNYAKVVPHSVQLYLSLVTSGGVLLSDCPVSTLKPYFRLHCMSRLRHCASYSTCELCLVTAALTLRYHTKGDT